MNVEAFVLCDAATDQQGKLNILGAFDNIFAKNVPYKHPSCAVAVRVRFEKVEEGEHPVRINIIDDDGNATGPKLQGKISVRVRENANSSVVNLILNIHGLELKAFGNYRVDLAIDNQVGASLPLAVREIPQN